MDASFIGSEHVFVIHCRFLVLPWSWSVCVDHGHNPPPPQQQAPPIAKRTTKRISHLEPTTKVSLSLVQSPLNWFLLNRTCFCNVFINMPSNNNFFVRQFLSPSYFDFVPTDFWFFIVSVFVCECVAKLVCAAMF